MKVADALKVVEHLNATEMAEYAKIVEKLFTEVHAQKLETANIIMGYEAELVKLNVKYVSPLSTLAIKRYHELMDELNTGKDKGQQQ